MVVVVVVVDISGAGDGAAGATRYNCNYANVHNRDHACFIQFKGLEISPCLLLQFRLKYIDLFG